VSLLTDDAVVTMPPLPLVYEGREHIAAFMRQRAELRGVPMRLVPTRANTQPAFAAYLPGHRPYGLFVLTLDGDAVSAITWFADTSVLRHFAL
jgi:RNA polymerase sigma-70 factor (ECF subfamily)